MLLVVLVNAISIKEGGPLVVFLKLLDALIRMRSDITWHLIINEKVKNFIKPRNWPVKLWFFFSLEKSPIFLRLWYEFDLPRLAKKIHADVIFSLTNYLPSKKLTVPTLLLVQHAGHFSEDFIKLQNQRYRTPIFKCSWALKNRWVLSSIQNSTLTTVQTEALSGKIRTQTGLPADRVIVVSHGPGVCEFGAPKTYPEEHIWRIGYIATYGIQKNFSVLIETLAHLIASGRKITLILSLAKNLPETKQLLYYAEKLGIAEYIENVGHLHLDDIQNIYDSLDLFVFPSVCESFGFPMVEAMARGLPLIAADVPVCREIAGDAARYYEPSDSKKLAIVLKDLMDNKPVFEHASELSLNRAKKYSWQTAALKTIEILENISKTI